MTLHRPYSSSESVLETAGRELLGSITGGGRWVDALDTALPKLNCLGGTLSCIMPPRLFGVPSSDMTETFEAIAAGRTPPLTEATRMIPAPQDGFLCDQMDLYRSPRERDAFYMDFIRRRGLAYQFPTGISDPPWMKPVADWVCRRRRGRFVCGVDEPAYQLDSGHSKHPRLRERPRGR